VVASRSVAFAMVSRRETEARARVVATTVGLRPPLILLVVACLWTAAGFSSTAPVAAKTPAASLHCSMRDGKKRRKPTIRPPSSTPSPPPPSPKSGRVSADSQLSVRKQIALARAYKSVAQSTSPKPKVRTSFRRPKDLTADRAASLAAEAAGEASDRRYNMSAPPLMLVDGYNIIGFWPRLRKRRDRDDMAGARQMLLDDLIEYNSPKQYDLVCVFDAVGSKENVENYFGIAVVYTPSADLYIENECRRLGAEGTRQVWAATADNAIQVSARVHGAHVMSTRWLVQALKESRASTPKVLDEMNALAQRQAGKGGTLWDTLDPELQSSLSAALEPDPLAALGKREREAFEAARSLQKGGLESMPGAAGRAVAAARKRREAKVHAAAMARAARDRGSNSSAFGADSGGDRDAAPDGMAREHDDG